MRTTPTNRDRLTVADAMSHYLAQNPADAALLLGDNFYIRLKDADDPLIQELFEKTYDLGSFQFSLLRGSGKSRLLDRQCRPRIHLSAAPSRNALAFARALVSPRFSDRGQSSGHHPHARQQ